LHSIAEPQRVGGDRVAAVLDRVGVRAFVGITAHLRPPAPGAVAQRTDLDRGAVGSLPGEAGHVRGHAGGDVGRLADAVRAVGDGDAVGVELRGRALVGDAGDTEDGDDEHDGDPRRDRDASPGAGTVGFRSHVFRGVLRGRRAAPPGESIRAPTPAEGDGAQRFSTDQRPPRVTMPPKLSCGVPGSTSKRRHRSWESKTWAMEKSRTVTERSYVPGSSRSGPSARSADTVPSSSSGTTPPSLLLGDVTSSPSTVWTDTVNTGLAIGWLLRTTTRTVTSSPVRALLVG